MRRAAIAISTCAIALVACSDVDSPPRVVVVVDDTVALGELPAPMSSATTPLTPPTVPTTTVTPVQGMEPIAGPIGGVAEGNRVLLIGDSAMAAITPRHDGIGCAVLTDLGWQVRIEAEPARYLPFADDVIDAVVVDSGDDWDVVGLMFGHFIDTPVDEFATDLDRVLGRLGRRPVLLYTVAENDDETAIALNAVLRERGETLPNVVVVDWGAAVASEQVVDLVADDRTPTNVGMERIVLLTAAALGEAPTGTGDGTCLDPQFIDDGAIVVES